MFSAHLAGVSSLHYKKVFSMWSRFDVVGGSTLYSRILFVLLFSLPRTTMAEPAMMRISGTVSEYGDSVEFSSSDWNVPQVESNWLKVLAADLNSDGCDDLLVVESNQAGVRRLLSDCRTGFSPARTRLLTTLRTVEPLASLDIDGDNCNDLIFREDSRWGVLLLTCGGLEKGEPMMFDLPDAEVRRIAAGSLGDLGTPAIVFELPSGLGMVKSVPTDSRPDGNPYRTAWLGGTLVGVLKERSDIPSRVLTWNSGLRQHRALTLPEDEATRDAFPWTVEWERFSSWRYSFTGDFNGDGFSDLLVNGSGIAGWWMAFSKGDTAIERPIFLPLVPDKQFLFTTGDFEGKGVSALLGCESSRPTHCKVFALKRGPGVSGVLIRSQVSGIETLSDESGSYVLDTPLFENESITLHAEKEGFQFTQPMRHIDYRERYEGHAVSKIHFVAVPDRKFTHEIGQNTHLVPVVDGPKVCLGYIEKPQYDAQKWGTREECPLGYAWLSTSDTFPSSDPWRSLLFTTFCCPLPQSDIIVEHLPGYFGLRCPEGHVAIGAKPKAEGEKDPRQIRCARINHTRYRLGPETLGKYFGVGASSRFVGERLADKKIPLAFRYGIARRFPVLFGADGCVGTPPGSFYVGNSGKGKCDSHLFRELLYAGLPGDPPSGTPVAIFPKCSAITNPEDPMSGCLPSGR